MNERIALFGVPIDCVDPAQTLAILDRWLDGSETGRYLVTPNVDHVCKLSRLPALRSAYQQASLVVTDGVPVVWAARLLGKALPGVVTGSDLTPSLFGQARQRGGLRVFLLGAAPGVAEVAKSRIGARWPEVTVCGTCSPPFGFENDPAQIDAIVAQLQAARPEVLVIGLGAPKQELLAQRILAHNPAKVTLCVGGTIDFLAGNVHRAPAWLRKTGLEWVHRMLSEPARLGPRYARDAIRFPQLVWREWRASRP